MWEQLQAQAVVALPAAGCNTDASATKVGLLQARMAIHTSLEEMLFLPVVDSSMLTVDVAVTSPVEGIVRIVLSEDQARAIAIAGYACEPEALTDSMMRDMAAELVNTVAGNLMSSVLPPDLVFSLGLPEVLLADRIAQLPQATTYFMRVGRELLQVVVSDALIPA
ncbi:MAG TPA: hypothetical protein DCS43_02250 [Verrucomicrobia bacterium]|nr:hypothetical protein [Verrucomicrobiota bacterium]